MDNLTLTSIYFTSQVQDANLSNTSFDNFGIILSCEKVNDRKLNLTSIKLC